MRAIPQCLSVRSQLEQARNTQSHNTPMSLCQVTARACAQYTVTRYPGVSLSITARACAQCGHHEPWKIPNIESKCWPHIRACAQYTVAQCPGVSVRSVLSCGVLSTNKSCLVMFFPQNQLTIWKYPVMSRVTYLTSHTSRVLHMALSPDGQHVASAAADTTFRVWKCFARTKT